MKLICICFEANVMEHPGRCSLQGSIGWRRCPMPFLDSTTEIPSVKSSSVECCELADIMTDRTFGITLKIF